MKPYFALMVAALAMGVMPLAVSCSGGGGEAGVPSYTATTKYDPALFFAGKSEVWVQPDGGLTYVRMISDPGNGEDARTTTGRMVLVGQGMVVSLNCTFERMEETGGTLKWPGLRITFTSVDESSPNTFPISQLLHVQSAEVFMEVEEIQLGINDGSTRVELTSFKGTQPNFYFYENGEWTKADPENYKGYDWSGAILDGTARIYIKHF